jgi:hypothetical protein
MTKPRRLDVIAADLAAASRLVGEAAAATDPRHCASRLLRAIDRAESALVYLHSSFTIERRRGAAEAALEALAGATPVRAWSPADDVSRAELRELEARRAGNHATRSRPHSGAANGKGTKRTKGH